MERLCNVTPLAYGAGMSPALAKAIEEHRDELTPEEAHAFADEQTRQFFGLSVEEFIERAEAGKLALDDPMTLHLALLTGARLHSC